MISTVRAGNPPALVSRIVGTAQAKAIDSEQRHYTYAGWLGGFGPPSVFTFINGDKLNDGARWRDSELRVRLAGLRITTSEYEAITLPFLPWVWCLVEALSSGA